MITFYHTECCPKCHMLEKALNDKGIKYDSVMDTDVMIAKGFSSVPMLDVDGETLTFAKAMDYIKNFKG